MAFNFVDFLSFTGATNINEDAYATIAKGVLAYVKNQYGIYPETEDATFNVFVPPGDTAFYLPAAPVNEITNIAYNEADFAEADFSFYGRDIAFTTIISDYRIPVIVDANVGYSATTLPDDLKLAIYRHIVAVYHAIDKHTDNVAKAINVDGNTTYYLNEVVPVSSKQTYLFYAGRDLLRY